MYGIKKILLLYSDKYSGDMNNIGLLAIDTYIHKRMNKQTDIMFEA